MYTPHFKRILSLNDDVEEVYDEESCLVLSGNALKYPEIEVNLKFIITVRKIGSDEELPKIY
jgi:hypothetical protein